MILTGPGLGNGPAFSTGPAAADDPPLPPTLVLPEHRQDEIDRPPLWGDLLPLGAPAVCLPGPVAPLQSGTAPAGAAMRVPYSDDFMIQ